MFTFLKRNLKEFKIFAMRGNVMDMAIGIIIGAAFSKVIDSMVKDIIMPPLGWLMGRVDFSNLYLTLPGNNGEITHYPSLETAQAAGAVTINYGLFINTLITFFMVTLSVFFLIKIINNLQKTTTKDNDKNADVTTKTCPRCYSIIDIKATKCPYCTTDL